MTGRQDSIHASDGTLSFLSMLRGIRPEAGECRISSEMRLKKNEVLRKAIRSSTELVRSLRPRKVNRLERGEYRKLSNLRPEKTRKSSKTEGLRPVIIPQHRERQQMIDIQGFPALDRPARPCTCEDPQVL